MIDKIKSFFISLYNQLVTMNDSPQSIAVGFGLGVFLGILPGTGPVAALGISYLLKVNKAAALLGSIITNTWLSVVCFVLSLKIGALITGGDSQELYTQAKNLFDHFSWNNFWDVSLVHIVLPLIIGYLAVGAACGLMGYLIVRIILNMRKIS